MKGEKIIRAFVFFSLISILLISVGLIFPNISSAEDVHATPDQVDEMIWPGRTAYEIIKNKDYESYIKMMALKAFHEQRLWIYGKPKTTEAIMEYISEEWNKYDYKGLSNYDRIIRVAEGISQAIPGVGGIGEGLLTILSPEIRLVYAGRDRINAERNWLVMDTNRVRQNLEKLYRMAKEDPQFGYDYDAIFAQQQGVFIFDDAKTIIDRSPDFKQQLMVEQIYNAIGSDGSLTLAIEDLIAENRQSFAAIAVMISENRDLLVGIDQQQKIIIDYMDNEIKREEKERVAELERQEYEIKLASARSSVFILSTLVGINDPKLGHEIDVIGNAAIQVADAFSQATNMKGMKDLQPPF